MSWNKQSSVFMANATAANPFYASMPRHRQDLFLKAYGQSKLRPKAPSKKSAKDKSGRVRGPVADYAEDLIEARQHVMEIYEIGALRIGCSKSQLMHAVVTGNEQALARAMQRAAERAPEGGRDPDSDRVATIQQGWKAGYLLQTQIEMDLAGIRAEQAKLKIETSKGEKQVTSNPNAMKGVKVVNAKDAKRRAAKAKG